MTDLFYFIVVHISFNYNTSFFLGIYRRGAGHCEYQRQVFIQHFPPINWLFYSIFGHRVMHLILIKETIVKATHVLASSMINHNRHELELI